MSSTIPNFLEFLKRSPTAFHAGKEIVVKLAKAGFTPLPPNQSLEPGAGYFTQDSDSTVIAFHLPKKKPKRAILVASHLDSPALKLKPHPDFRSAGGRKLGVELYGSPLLSTWTNRDLGIAGRILYREGKTIKTTLVDLNDTPLIIPQLAIHFNKKANEEGVIFNKQTQLCPLFSLDEQLEKPFESYLKGLFPQGSVLDFDLFLYPLEKPRLVGKEQNLIASYRLDNLASAYAACEALVSTNHQEAPVLAMGLFYDHEEIGSMTKAGAFSPVAFRMLQKAFSSYSSSSEELHSFIQHSLCLSLDVAFGLDPNYVDRYDEENTPYLGKGIAIKYHGMRRYATSSRTAAMIIATCEEKKIPYQKFNMRSDLSSGTTIGPILESTMGIEAIDLGIPCLSMHAAREIISCKDYQNQIHLIKELLDHPIEIEQGLV